MKKFRKLAKAIFMLRTVAIRFFDDRLAGLAAEIAFFELLTIFPLLIFFVAVLGFFPYSDTVASTMGLLREVAPPESVQLVRNWILSIESNYGVTLMSVSALGALWGGSIGIGAFIDAFTALNRHKEGIGLIQGYVVRVIFTALSVVGLVLVLALWVVGPIVVQIISMSLGFEQLQQWIWLGVQFPLALFVILLGLMIFYHFLAYSERRFFAHLPGAVVAALLSWGASWLFSKYVSWIGDFNVTYGSLGGVIVLMLWLYALNLAILVGELWNLQLAAWVRFVASEEAEERGGAKA